MCHGSRMKHRPLPTTSYIPVYRAPFALTSRIIFNERSHELLESLAGPDGGLVLPTIIY